MAKITRVVQKEFGLNVGAAGQFAVFGSLAANSPAFSKDPKVIQSLDAWALAWSAATVGTKSPALEDMNSLFLVAFRQIAYIFQAGLPEWDADTTFYTDSRCRVAGEEYVSLSDGNIGNNPTTDTNNWVSRTILDRMKQYPVGELFLTRRDGDPSTLLGFGTWSRVGAGRFAVGRNPSDSDFATIGQQAGAKTAQIDGSNLPNYGTAHADGNAPGGSLLTTPTVNGTPLPVLNPYEVLFNAWIRLT